VKQAIRKTGFSRSAIYRWLASGKVTGKKLGRSTYITAASLRKAISELPDYRPVERR
jgi:predicted DNA-binding transcriptional regulator AlpA